MDDFFEDLQQADIEEKSLNQSTNDDNNDDSECFEDIHISEDVYQRLVISLKKLIDDDKIYLKKDLRLDEVAGLMFTNRMYVSKVIKKEFQCSFSDFINSKRIDFSIKLMSLEPNLTQDNIAEKSGFINAQSYSRTFKKLIGMPPKKWFYRNEM